MKKNYLFTFIVLYGFSLFGQTVNVSNCRKESMPGCGIDKDMVYSAIMSSDIAKESLISRSKSLFVKEGLISENEIEIIKYNSELSEFNVPFGLKKGMTIGKALMGFKYTKTPVILYFDALFSFNNSGELKVTFSNFKEESFIMVNKDADFEFLLNWPEVELPIFEKKRSLEIAETGMGKFLVFANGFGLEKIEEIRSEYLMKLTEEFQMYNEVVERGNAKWLTDQELEKYENPTSDVKGGPLAKWSNKKGNQLNSKIVGSLIEANKIVNVDNQTWNDFFQKTFDYYFKRIAKLIEGDISGIALNGILLYENVDGKILPVDKKLRKKWLKKNIEF